MKKVLTFIFLFSVLPVWGGSKELSGMPLFVRCYMHLTQKFPARDNEYRLKVESGEMQPIEVASPF